MRTDMKYVKINITMPESLLQKVDGYAKKNAMTRSGLLQLAVNQYITAQEAMPSINNAFALMGSLAKRAADGEINSEAYDAELKALNESQAELKEKAAGKEL